LTDNKSLRFLAVIAWMGVIFFLSAQPTLPHVVFSLSSVVQDVMGHFCAYAVLAGLLYWALTGVGSTRPALFTFVIVLLYALSDEFHQSFVPGRNPDPFDVATDLVGALAALAALTLFRYRRARRPLR
jgi:VanZ family protein